MELYSTDWFGMFLNFGSELLFTSSHSENHVRKLNSEVLQQ